MSEAIQLHTVVVWLKGHQGVNQYVFRTRDRALEAFNALSEKTLGIVALHDDFGRSLLTLRENIDAIQLNDCAAELNGQAEIAILQAHGQVKLQKRAEADSVLSGRGPQLVRPGAPVMPFPGHGPVGPRG